MHTKLEMPLQAKPDSWVWCLLWASREGCISEYYVHKKQNSSGISIPLSHICKSIAYKVDSSSINYEAEHGLPVPLPGYLKATFPLWSTSMLTVRGEKNLGQRDDKFNYICSSQRGYALRFRTALIRSRLQCQEMPPGVFSSREQGRDKTNKTTLSFTINFLFKTQLLQDLLQYASFFSSFFWDQELSEIWRERSSAREARGTKLSTVLSPPEVSAHRIFVFVTSAELLPLRIVGSCGALVGRVGHSATPCGLMVYRDCAIDTGTLHYGCVRRESWPRRLQPTVTTLRAG